MIKDNITLITANTKPILNTFQISQYTFLRVLLSIFTTFQKVKGWIESRKKKDGKGDSKRTERGKRIWNKYGMPGLALLGPIVIGTHIAAFIGLLFGASKVNTIIWMTISIGLWTLVFGIATAMGFDLWVENV